MGYLYLDNGCLICVVKSDKIASDIKFGAILLEIFNIILTFIDFYGIITIRGDNMARLVKLFNTSDIYVADTKKDLLLKIVEKAKEFYFIT